MAVLPSEGHVTENRYMAYITEDKLGIQKFPLTGNPFDSIAIYAHPDGVKFLFLCDINPSHCFIYVLFCKKGS